MSWTSSLTLLFLLVHIGLTLLAMVPVGNSRRLPSQLSWAIWLFIWISPLMHPPPLRVSIWIATTLLLLGRNRVVPFLNSFHLSSNVVLLYLISCLTLSTFWLVLNSGNSVSAMTMAIVLSLAVLLRPASSAQV